MDINYIALAIPVFFLLIGLEFVLARKQKQELYQLQDFANNVSCGVFEQIAALPVQGLLVYGYYYLSQHYAWMVISPDSLYSWVALWLGVDFLYYWFHRASHRCALLWAGHAVHHQSEYYNLSVSLRQGIIQTLFSWIAYLPLAVIGFPLWMYLTMASFNTLYQFWIHTTLIKRLGFLEKIFNTPSHHRVHHGKNPCYLDKNYAGSLIIWDKLFGTFAKEEEAPQYGTTEPLNSWNVFYANIKVLKDLWYYAQAIDSLWLRWTIFLRPPEWIIHYYQEQGLEFPHSSVQTAVFQGFSKGILFFLTMLIGQLGYLLFHFQVDQMGSYAQILLIGVNLVVIQKMSQGAFFNSEREKTVLAGS